MPRPKGESKRTARVSSEFYEHVEKYRKEHRIPTWFEALSSMMKESDELKRKNVSLKEEGRKLQWSLKDYERLNEESFQNLELRKMLSSQAKEIKFMKDTIVSELNRIFEIDSILDVKINIEKLINEITKKADFELQKIGT